MKFSNTRANRNRTYRIYEVIPELRKNLRERQNSIFISIAAGWKNLLVSPDVPGAKILGTKAKK